ncbi:MAG TPA: hypothetical protein VNO21_20005 [Polyangiaceae bacterium]|nr:hypothetical protein [Polyangiaceae bacterium]
MSTPTFAELVQEAQRHLEDAEEVLRLPWRGDNPSDAELDALDDARGHIAAARTAILRVNALGEDPDAAPRSRKRTQTRAAKPEAKVGRAPR